MTQSSLLLLAGLWLCPAATAQQTGIHPFSGNPAYWQYNGEPMLLVGGSDDDNLYQWAEKDLLQQLDALVHSGGNYLRCTMSYRDEGNAAPWIRLEDGRYDLDRPNPGYWESFDRFLRECSRRDIVVQVEVWATYDILTGWEKSPFRPSNNVNYAAENTTLPDAYSPGAWPGEPDRPCPFYHTVPGRNGDRTVLVCQQAFVDRLLSVSLKYENVLYCIDNEIWTSAPVEWGWYWSRYIKGKAASSGRPVYVTEMFCFAGFDIRYGEKGLSQIRGVLDHPDTYDYLDISNTGMFRGEYFYRQVYEVVYQLGRQERPRPLNFVKIYGNPDAGFDLAQASGGVENFWISVMTGSASVRFHRPPTGLGLSETAKRQIRAMREFEALVRPWECRPMMELTLDNYQNEAYLIANPGKAYGLYFPESGLDGRIGLDLRGVEGDLSLRWLDVDTGEWTEPGTVRGGDWRSISVPDTKNRYGWVAVVTPG